MYFKAVICKKMELLNSAHVWRMQFLRINMSQCKRPFVSIYTADSCWQLFLGLAITEGDTPVHEISTEA